MGKEKLKEDIGKNPKMGGRFTVDIVQIIDGRTTVWGKLLDGNT